MNISKADISQTVTDRTLLLTTNKKLHVCFRLADSNLTLAYSKGQFGCWNGVSPNSLAFLLNVVTTARQLMNLLTELPFLSDLSFIRDGSCRLPSIDLQEEITAYINYFCRCD